MSTYKNLTTVCAAVVLAFGLAACGGGDDDTAMEPTPPVMPDPEPMEYDVALPAGHGLNPGTTTIPAGTTAMLASGTYIACGGTEDCTLTIGIESVTGALSASSTGGMVAVSTAASRVAAVHAANQQTLVGARAALAELEAMDPGEITPNQLAAAQMALASALALSGNEDAPENQPPAMPDPEPTPVAVAVPDAGYLDDDNMPMAGTHMLAAGETATSGGVTFLCAEGGDACEVTIADDGSVEATGGTVTASLTADAMTQVADAKAMTAEMDEADRLVRRNRAIGEDRALESAERLVSGTAGGTSGIDVANIIPSRSAGMQASVRITAPAGYAKVEDMMNGDWGGTRRSRVTGPNTDELVVFTDREEPTLVQFYNFDRLATTPSRYTDGSPPGHTNPYGPGDIPMLTPLPIQGGAAPAGRFTRGVLDRSEFPQPGPTEGGLVTQRYRMASATVQITTFQGNYNGAGGTYSCDSGTPGQACVVNVAPNGAYTSADTWTFTPELNARAYQADATFMSFGWWLRTPRNPDGAYAFEYYADGQAFVPNATTPTGTATYTGRAAGRYAVQEVDGTGVVDGMSGEFTAAASLTANFSARDIGGMPAPTVEGTISGFQGEMDGMSGWMVTLNQQALANNAAALGASFTSGEIDPTAAGFDGVTAVMGDQTAHGSWTGQFFGNAATVTDPNNGGSTATNVLGAAPVGVGGTFQADNESVSIAGAFGARR